MTTYRFYEIEKAELIKLAKFFNEVRKIITKEKIDYSDFSNYYDKYFGAVINNSLGFDYISYGYMLLNATVILKTTDEEKSYNEKRKMLSSFIADYIIKKEESYKINPREIYNSKVMKKANN